MSAGRSRYTVLSGVFGVGVLLLALVDVRQTRDENRWPADEAVYAVSDWTMTRPSISQANGISFVSRGYRNTNGTEVTLFVSTSVEAKRIYRAGADVPFLGNGYVVDPAPPSLVPSHSPYPAFVASRGDELWLQFSSYGERRGMLGNGALAWGLASVDTLLGRSNDYYLARLLVPLAGNDPAAAERASALAEQLFPRLAAWYAA